MEEKRTRIVEAAREMFLREGYRRASLATLLSRLGISKPTFYNYFRNKHHLFAEVMAATYDEFLFEYGRLTRHARGAVERLGIFVRAYADFLDSFPIFSEVHRPGNDLAPEWLGTTNAMKLCADGVATLQSVIEAGVAEGTFDGGFDAASAALVVHRTISLVLAHPCDGERPDVDSLLRLLATGLLARSSGE